MSQNEHKVKAGDPAAIEVEEQLIVNVEGQNTATMKPAFLFSARFVLGVMCFFGSMNLYAIRTNLSISMPCMAIDPKEIMDSNFSKFEEIETNSSNGKVQNYTINYSPISTTPVEINTIIPQQCASLRKEFSNFTKKVRIYILSKNYFAKFQ